MIASGFLTLFLGFAFDAAQSDKYEYLDNDWRWRGSVIVEYTTRFNLSFAWVHDSALRDGLDGEAGDSDLLSVGYRYKHLFLGAGYDIKDGGGMLSDGKYDDLNENDRWHFIANLDYQFDTSHWIIPNTVRAIYTQSFNGDIDIGAALIVVGWTFNFEE